MRFKSIVITLFFTALMLPNVLPAAQRPATSARFSLTGPSTNGLNGEAAMTTYCLIYEQGDWVDGTFEVSGTNTACFATDLEKDVPFSPGDEITVSISQVQQWLQSSELLQMEVDGFTDFGDEFMAALVIHDMELAFTNLSPSTEEASWIKRQLDSLANLIVPNAFAGIVTDLLSAFAKKLTRDLPSDAARAVRRQILHDTLPNIADVIRRGVRKTYTYTTEHACSIFRREGDDIIPVDRVLRDVARTSPQRAAELAERAALRQIRYIHIRGASCQEAGRRIIQIETFPGY